MPMQMSKARAEPLGVESNGILMTRADFERAEFDECWNYELINGVLIVHPLLETPEADMNEQLGCWLRHYRDAHPMGSALTATLPFRFVSVGESLYLVSRVIWTGLSRLPRRGEPPSIVVDFVSTGTPRREKDYFVRFGVYSRVGVKEYWLIDRYRHVMTVCSERFPVRHVRSRPTYASVLLPDFKLNLRSLFELGDAWREDYPE